VEGVPSGRLFGDYDFLLRRLHSLSGIIPVGAYMFIHLLTNATVWDGARAFQSRVDLIHSLGWMLPFVEWTFIFLPIIFHAVVGVLIMRTGHQNVGSYPYPGNIRYYLQRLTAWIALVFIFWHVFEMHGWVQPIASHFTAGARFRHLYATSSAAAVIQNPVIATLYIVGVLACVYHLANGLWTAGITWGLWTTAAAQRRANYVCGAAGMVLAAVGLAAFFGMISQNVEKAYQIERQINQAKLEEGEITEEEFNNVPRIPGLTTPDKTTSPVQAGRQSSREDRS
jgi:succinate dehydrogenase / fumarate reductase cytochrome b subunit